MTTRWCEEDDEGTLSVHETCFTEYTTNQHKVNAAESEEPIRRSALDPSSIP